MAVSLHKDSLLTSQKHKHLNLGGKVCFLWIQCPQWERWCNSQAPDYWLRFCASEPCVLTIYRLFGVVQMAPKFNSHVPCLSQTKQYINKWNFKHTICYQFQTSLHTQRWISNLYQFYLTTFSILWEQKKLNQIISSTLEPTGFQKLWHIVPKLLLELCPRKETDR